MITSFSGQYEFLSNFFPCTIWMHGKKFPSSEHAYQFHKLARAADHDMLLLLEKPGKAMRFAQKCELIPDWDELKLGIMLEVVLAKFQQNEELRFMLRETKGQTLIEGNYWGDEYWGCVPGIVVHGDEEWVGENHLGRILMTVRDYLI